VRNKQPDVLKRLLFITAAAFFLEGHSAQQVDIKKMMKCA